MSSSAGENRLPADLVDDSRLHDIVDDIDEERTQQHSERKDCNFDEKPLDQTDNEQLGENKIIDCIDKSQPLYLIELCTSSGPLKMKQHCNRKTIHETTDLCKDSDEYHYELNLTDLPPEVILVLFSYLDARFTLQVMSCVCKRFHHLLFPEAIWKTRFEKRWPLHSVARADKYISSWKQVCVQTEDMHRFWFDAENELEFFQLRNHFAPVDAVHVMHQGSICLSGSRDRYICVWDLNTLKSGSTNHNNALKCSFNNHQGWVWTLASDPTGGPRFCSGSWDSTVKLWDLNTEKETMTIRKEHKAAVLCMSWRPDVLITGSYDKRIRMFDLREGTKPLQTFSGHKKPVLCVVANDDYIISGSEDKTLNVYDRRAALTLKTVKTESPVFSLHQTNYGHCYLLAGGRAGNMHLYETINGTFEHLETVSSGHQGKVTGICESQGAIVSCSSDHSVKVLDPSCFSTLHSFTNHGGEVAAIHSASGVVASASSDLTIGIWKTKL